MELKEFIKHNANKDNPIGDLCADIIHVNGNKGYDWSMNDDEVLSAIEGDISKANGGMRVMSAFKRFKKAYKNQKHGY